MSRGLPPAPLVNPPGTKLPGDYYMLSVIHRAANDPETREGAAAAHAILEQAKAQLLLLGYIWSAVEPDYVNSTLVIDGKHFEL